MEPRLIIAHALMLAIALVAGLTAHQLYHTRDRTFRRRARVERRIFANRRAPPGR